MEHLSKLTIFTKLVLGNLKNYYHTYVFDSNEIKLECLINLDRENLRICVIIKIEYPNFTSE